MTRQEKEDETCCIGEGDQDNDIVLDEIGESSSIL